jgi:hypothetical protein
MTGIGFALNWPTEYELLYYNAYDCVYRVRYLEGGWYEINLDETFVRSCMTHAGEKQWTAEKAEPVDWDAIFNRGEELHNANI